jgi:hypothetical protein
MKQKINNKRKGLEMIEMHIYDKNLKLIATTPWKSEYKEFFHAVVVDLGMILSFGPLHARVQVGN